MAKWTEDQKLKALAIAETSTVREAAEQTGIPDGSIKRWRKELRANEPNERTEPKVTIKKVSDVAEDAIEKATEEINEYVIDRVKQTADNILALVEQAVCEAGRTIREGPKDDEPNAGWLRALIGAMGQGAEKYQLFTGQPTSRQAVDGQVSTKYEYHVEQIIKQDEETQQLLESLYERSLRTSIPTISEE